MSLHSFSTTHFSTRCFIVIVNSFISSWWINAISTLFKRLTHFQFVSTTTIMISSSFSLSFEYVFYLKFDLLTSCHRVAISSLLFIVTLNERTYKEIVYNWIDVTSFFFNFFFNQTLFIVADVFLNFARRSLLSLKSLWMRLIVFAIALRDVLKFIRIIILIIIFFMCKFIEKTCNFIFNVFVAIAL